jgi:hypothetical protein
VKQRCEGKWQKAEAQPELLKFLGSFFQKRTACFAACLPCRRSPYLRSYKKEPKTFASLGSLYPEEPEPKQSVAPSPVFSWVIS